MKSEKFSGKANKNTLSIIYNKCIVDKTYSITEEGLACFALGDIAYVIEVVCAFTAFFACCKSVSNGKRLGDVVIVVAVGTGKVEAYHLALCLTNFRYIGKAYDKSAQPQIKTCITHNGRKGNIGCHGRTFKNELLAILREGNGAELTHAVACNVKGRRLIDILKHKFGRQIAVGVVSILTPKNRQQTAYK